VAAIASGEVPLKAGKPNIVLMYTVYILYSDRFSRYYTGHSHDYLSRLQDHNRGKVKSTKAYIPWRVIHKEDFETKSEAFRREMQIKSFKTGEAFFRLFNK
jgi:putative endonuclease